MFYLAGLSSYQTHRNISEHTTDMKQMSCSA